MPAAVAVPAGLGVLGAIAGSQKDVSSSQSNSESQLIAAPASQQETQARQMAFDSLTGLDQRLKALEASPVLNNLDKLLQEMGQAPSAERIGQANQYAAQVYAPQATALQQSLDDFNVDFARRAAQMGRSSADPILAAKMAQESIRQKARLASEQGSFAAQEAMNAPGRMFQNQLSGLSGLGAQAMQNRQAIYSMGSSFANDLQNYRLQTGIQRGVQIGRQESGGGFKGAVTGAIGGAGAGVQMMNPISSLFSSAPSLPSSPIYSFNANSFGQAPMPATRMFGGM